MQTYDVNKWGVNRHYVEFDGIWFRFCSSKIDSIGRMRSLITVELHRDKANALLSWMREEIQKGDKIVKTH